MSSNSDSQMFNTQDQGSQGQQQFQNNGQYDASGLAQKLQDQHLNSRAPSSPQRPRTSGSLQAGSDYVVFERNTETFSPQTREKAAATKLKVELFYNQNVQHAVERNQRYVLDPLGYTIYFLRSMLTLWKANGVGAPPRL